MWRFRIYGDHTLYNCICIVTVLPNQFIRTLQKRSRLYVNQNIFIQFTTVSYIFTNKHGSHEPHILKQTRENWTTAQLQMKNAVSLVITHFTVGCHLCGIVMLTNYIPLFN